MKRFLFLPGIAAAALLLASCNRRAEGSAVVQAAPTVAVQPIARGDVEQTMRVAAAFRPYQEIEVHAKVSGYVKSIRVDVGDRVKAGQLLAELEIPELEDDMVQNDAEVRRAEEEVNRSKADLQRARSAYDVAHLASSRLSGVSKAKPTLVAQQDVDEATGRDKVAEAQVATAQAALAAAGEQLDVAKAGRKKTATLTDYARITAPFDGVITRRYTDPGAMIQAGTSSQTQAMPVVTLSDNARLRLVIPVPESAVADVHVGSPVQVRVDALDRTIGGTVARFADRLDADTRTMHVEVDVPNADLSVVPGMYAEASIVLRAAKNVIVAPVDAIDRTGDSAHTVIVNAKHQIEPRDVSLGLASGDRVQVTSGLSPGDLIVVGPRGQLTAGATVTPKVLGEGIVSRFSLRNPYLIVVICLVVSVIGLTSLARMPVDLFPDINIPQVAVATFYSGMPPEQIETDITGRFERFFTQGAGIDHMESRSLPGVSIIKVIFQPGTNADADVSEISNLAMADLRRLPPGTLPPIVQKFDASSLPVALVTLKGSGLSETELRDLGQFTVRNQLAGVPGASVPTIFGGKYRQIMIYVDPDKLQAYELSPMDVVRAVNNANLILPSGDVKVGPLDYTIFTNSQFREVPDIGRIPLKTTAAGSMVLVRDVARVEDGAQIQTNVVKVDGQRSAYVPVMKQGGDTNTIAVVDGLRSQVAGLLDIPAQLVTDIVFDQSAFVKNAIDTLLHEGAIGLVLTGGMVLIFLGSMTATAGVFLAIPISVLGAIIMLYTGGSSINTMILAGFALVFSRLIDNAVIVLENIFRHMELGETPRVAAEKGGDEVSLAVLAATLTSSVVFFPVTFLYGVSRFLFSALALAVVLSLVASYFVAMTVVPLFCARFLTAPAHAGGHAPGTVPKPAGAMTRFNRAFSARFERMLALYERRVRASLERPRVVVATTMGVFLVSLLLFPFLGVAFFPRTDAGQFVMNVKAPSGTRIEVTTADIDQLEALVRHVVDPRDLKLVLSNIGVVPGYSSLYTSNAGPHTGTVQVALADDHRIGSYEYMARMRRAVQEQFPNLTIYFQSGGIVDAVLNQGLPAPIDVQLSGSDIDAVFKAASGVASRIRALPGVSDVFIPQDVDYPSLRLDVDRERAAALGLDQKEVVDNMITALTSNQMIAPSFWVDPKSGNDYLLTVQYPENRVGSLLDLRSIPLHAGAAKEPTLLDAVSHITQITSPTEIDHYQIRRVIDIYVNPAGEDLGTLANGVRKILASTKLGSGVKADMRGMVQGMQQSFTSFAMGLSLALLLLYLILVAQFRSFVDPILILLAVPTGITGVLVMLWSTGTTLNVQSLMGVLMMVGMVVSNSILIVEFAHRLEEDGMPVLDAVVSSCRIRLRPILMTSLATVFGLIPMALKLGTGSEAYAPLARAIIGGLLVSVALTVFLVPAAYLLVYRGRPKARTEAQ